MANATEYHVLFYGTEDGYGGNRAQIALYRGSTVLGYIRFHDEGMPFPADSESGGQIFMHLPSCALDSVLGLLRHERPINFYFTSGQAFLGTSTEPVGEEES